MKHTGFSGSYSFLFRELVSRDFKKRYHHSILGVLWSVISPLCTFLVMRLIFTHFFGRDTPHYSTYLFSGIIVLSYFTEATKQCMSVYLSNRAVIEKINLPKYLFPLSKNTASFINFIMTVFVFLILGAFDGIEFGWHMLSLIYPILCMAVICVGVGLVLSVIYVYFRDFTYIYDVFLIFVRYASAVFYDITKLPQAYHSLFLFNPVYVAIRYFRNVVIDQQIPSFRYHVLLGAYALIALSIGTLVYRKNQEKLIYNF